MQVRIKNNLQPILLTCLSRGDKDFVSKSGLRRAFHVGGNSSCRQHLRQHWNLYKKKCEESNTPINHWAIPRHVWRQMKADKTKQEPNDEPQQSTLGFEKVTGPREFTREGVLEAVTKLIATDDQVRDLLILICVSLTFLPCQSLALASNTAFRNCLVAMRPRSTVGDLPSTHNMKVYLHNQFVEQLKLLKDNILVSMITYLHIHRKKLTSKTIGCSWTNINNV